MNIAKHISAANKAFNKKHPIASLRSARISDGMCTVGDLFTQYSFPIKIKGQGCIDWLDLRAVLKAGLTHGEILIEDNGAVTGTAILYCNTTRIELEASMIDDYPVINYGSMYPPRAFSCNILLTALKFATPPDPEAGWVPLNGVNLAEARITATNGSVIYQRDTHVPLIKLTLNPKAVSMLQPCGQVTIEEEYLHEHTELPAPNSEEGKQNPWTGPMHSIMRMEDAVIVSRNIDNQYPNAAQLFFDPMEKVNLNRRMVDAALERLAPILNDTSVVTLSIAGYRASLSATAESPDKHASVDLGEVITQKDFHRDFRAENLALAMITDLDEFQLAWTYTKNSLVTVNGNLLAGMVENNLED